MGELVTIDGKQYDLDIFSGDTKATMALLQHVDGELKYHSMKMAQLQVARDAYSQSLKAAVEAVKPVS